MSEDKFNTIIFESITYILSTLLFMKGVQNTKEYQRAHLGWLAFSFTLANLLTHYYQTRRYSIHNENLLAYMFFVSCFTTLSPVIRLLRYKISIKLLKTIGRKILFLLQILLDYYLFICFSFPIIFPIRFMIYLITKIRSYFIDKKYHKELAIYNLQETEREQNEYQRKREQAKYLTIYKDKKDDVSAIVNHAIFKISSLYNLLEKANLPIIDAHQMNVSLGCAKQSIEHIKNKDFFSIDTKKQQVIEFCETLDQLESTIIDKITPQYK